MSGNVEIGGNGGLTFDQSSAQTLGNAITSNGLPTGNVRAQAVQAGVSYRF